TLAAKDASGLELLKWLNDSQQAAAEAVKLNGKLRGQPGADIFLGVPPVVARKEFDVFSSILSKGGQSRSTTTETDDLINEITQATAVYPDGILYFSKGFLLQERERFTEAKQFFRKAADTPSVLGPYARLQGLCFLALGQIGNLNEMPK